MVDEGHDQHQVEQLALLQHVTRRLETADMEQVRAAWDTLDALDLSALQATAADLEATQDALRGFDVPVLPKVLDRLQDTDLKKFQLAKHVLQNLDMTELQRFQDVRHEIQGLDVAQFLEFLRSRTANSNLKQMHKLLDIDLAGFLHLQEQARTLPEVDVQEIKRTFGQAGTHQALDLEGVGAMQSDGGRGAPAHGAHTAGQRLVEA